MRVTVASSGYEAVTIEGLADAAGVPKQTTYRWWPSKAAILGEALLEGELQVPSLPMTDDLAADLHALFSWQDSGETVALARALIAVTVIDLELGARLNERLAAPTREWTKERLARGVAAGEVREDVDARVVADLLIALSSYSVLVGLPVDAERTEQVVELVERGLSAG